MCLAIDKQGKPFENACINGMRQLGFNMVA